MFNRLIGGRLATVFMITWSVASVIYAGIVLRDFNYWNHNDSAYYLASANNISRGEMLNESVIWHHLNAYSNVEHPSFDYWQPFLPLFIALVSFLTADVDVAARLFILVTGSLIMPLLVASLVRLAGGTWQAAIFASFALLSIPELNHFRLFLDTVLVSGSLYAAFVAGIIQARRLTSRKRFLCLMVSGIFLGINAALRGDGLPVGLLLIVAVGLIDSGCRTQTVLALCLGFFLVLAPVYARNCFLFGTPFCPSNSKVIWITKYDELYGFSSDGSLAKKSLIDYMKVRYHGFKAAFTAFRDFPGYALSSAVVVLFAGAWINHLLKNRSLKSVEILVVLTIATTIALIGCGVVFAPVINQWSGRALVPLAPLLVASASAGVSVYLQQCDDLRIIRSFPLALAIGISPIISLNPANIYYLDEPLTSLKYRSIVASLPSDSIVLTNEPFLLYLFGKKNVIKIPLNGEQAIESVIKQYKADILVLVDHKPSTEVSWPRYSDATLDEVFSEERRRIGDEVLLNKVGSKLPFGGVQIFRIDLR